MQDIILPNVLYLLKEGEKSHISNMIIRALETGKHKSELTYSVSDPYDLIANSKKIVSKTDIKDPDAIIGTDETIEKIGPLFPEAAAFNLENMFKEDDSFFLLDHPAGEWATLGDNGDFSSNSEDWRYGNIEEAKESLKRLFEDIEGSELPSGGFGGRVAGGWESAAGKIWRFIKEIVNAALGHPDRDVNWRPDGGPGIPSDAGVPHPPDEGKSDPEKGGGVDPDNTGTEREPEESGMDLMVFLWIMIHKVEADRLWKEISSGRIPPEHTDLMQEYIDWLVLMGMRNQNGWQAMHDDQPLPEDDDTRYSFRYWLWKELRNAKQTIPNGLYYWWRRGAPIDPVLNIFTVGSVKYMVGHIVKNKQHLRFILF